MPMMVSRWIWRSTLTKRMEAVLVGLHLINAPQLFVRVDFGYSCVWALGLHSFRFGKTRSLGESGRVGRMIFLSIGF
jgi:hypothetical protein